MRTDIRTGSSNAAFWDAAAQRNAAWYIATAHSEESPAFFAQGARETDELLQFCGISLTPTDVVLEIGCGIGRMTHRLADLAGQVIATDISMQMLRRAAENLWDRPNVSLIAVPGDGHLPLPDGSVDVVFSYITLQHVPRREDQLRYLRESIRCLRPGGRMAVQLRAPGPAARAYDWAGHLVHLFQRRRTLHPAWRGRAVPAAAVLALRGPQLAAQLKPLGHRHVWFVAARLAE